MNKKQEIEKLVGSIISQLDRYFEKGQATTCNEVRIRSKFVYELLDQLEEWKSCSAIRYPSLFNNLIQMQEGVVLLHALNSKAAIDFDTSLRPQNVVDAFRSDILAEFARPGEWPFQEEPAPEFQIPLEDEDLIARDPFDAAVSLAVDTLSDKEIIERYKKKFGLSEKPAAAEPLGQVTTADLIPNKTKIPLNQNHPQDLFKRKYAIRNFSEWVKEVYDNPYHSFAKLDAMGALKDIKMRADKIIKEAELNPSMSATKNQPTSAMSSEYLKIQTLKEMRKIKHDRRTVERFLEIVRALP